MMKLGTIICIIVVLVGCGVATTNMMSVGVPREDLEKAQKAMEEAEKRAKFSRAYPAPMPPPISSQEPKGGGAPKIERKEQITIQNKTDTTTNQLFSAALAFVIPDKANIDESIKAQLLINIKKEVEALTQELTKKGSITSKEIKVSRIVKATLIAPDFTVINITEEEQILLDDVSTEWLWSLVPKTSGAHDISLNVSAVIKYDGRESKHHIKTFEKTITINITPEQVIDDWFNENWKWVISTLIIPLFGFVFKEKIKKLLGLS